MVRSPSKTADGEGADEAARPYLPAPLCLPHPGEIDLVSAGSFPTLDLESSQRAVFRA